VLQTATGNFCSTVARYSGNTWQHVVCDNVACYMLPIGVRPPLRRPYTKATIGNMLPTTFFSNGIEHHVRDVLCYAVSVLSSYEDGVVILALLKETDEFTSLILSSII
jgi:hypothetical protein